MPSELELVRQALSNGKVQAAVVSFQEAAAHSDDVAALTDATTQMLREAYDGFRIAPLMAFAGWLRKQPDRQLASAALGPLVEPLNEVNRWRKELGDIAGERLARELRAFVRTRKIEPAINSAARILSGALSDKERSLRARQIGTILGSLAQDRSRCEDVMRQLARRADDIGLNDERLAVMHEVYEKTQTGLSVSEMGEHERMWDRLRTDAVVQLIRKLPGPGSTDAKPTAESEAKFYDALHTMLAAYFAYADTTSDDAAHDEATARFLDVVGVLREFCPTDERAAGAVDGVEEVAFLRIPPTDRVIAVRALRRLGKRKRLVDTVVRAARTHTAGRPAELLIYLMGGLSNSAFHPFLTAALREKKLASVHGVVVDTLGRIGDANSLKTLLALFDACLKVRVLDPPARRRLSSCLGALGRVARHPSTSAEQRDQIVGRVFRVLPDDRPLANEALNRFCSWNPGGLGHDVQRLVLPRVMDALWTVRSGGGLAQTNSGQASELGEREGLVKMLVDMGKKSLPALLEQAERHASQYSAAYMAMGEVLTKVGDATALGFLERALLITLRTDDSATPEHLRETYFDAAQDRQMTLSQDKVAHSLVYAIHKAGGPAGIALLEDVTQRIKDGEFYEPGGETMELLARILVNDGSQKPAADSEAPVSSLDDEMSGIAAFGESTDAAPPRRPQREERALEGESIKSLLKAIAGKGLFGVKIEKRVAAIQEVAARKDLDALPVLSELLRAKDSVVVASAERALLEILNPRQKEVMYRDALYAFVECMRGATGRLLKSISLLIDRLRPEREPTKSLLFRFMESESEERLRKDVADLFRIANERLGRSGKSVEVPDTAPDGAGGSAPSGQEAMTLKRDYFAARRAWIDGGKQGPAPTPPPGM